MVAGSARDDVHAIDGSQLVIVQRKLVELQVPVHHAPGKRVADGTRLFVDLLEHEVGVAALLGGVDVPVHVRDFGLDGIALHVHVLDRRLTRGRIAG